MSKLSEQCDELREAARNIQGNLGRCLYRRKDVDGMQQVSDLLFEAANTIESLRNKLQELQGVTDESNYDRLFGTPEKAARTLLDACDNCGQDECSGCQVYELTSGGDLDYDALIEWLKGEAE